MFPDQEENPEGGATFPLSGDALINWLGTAGQGFLLGEGSGAEQLSFLRANGVKISTQSFYNVRANVLYQNNQVETLRRPLEQVAAQNPDYLIPLGYTFEPQSFGISANFLYRFAINGYDPVDGSPTTEYMAVSSDRQLTFNEAQDLMLSMTQMHVSENGETTTYKGNVFQSVSIDAAMKKGSAL